MTIEEKPKEEPDNKNLEESVISSFRSSLVEDLRSWHHYFSPNLIYEAEGYTREILGRTIELENRVGEKAWPCLLSTIVGQRFVEEYERQDLHQLEKYHREKLSERERDFIHYLFRPRPFRTTYFEFINPFTFLGYITKYAEMVRQGSSKDLNGVKGKKANSRQIIEAGKKLEKALASSKEAPLMAEYNFINALNGDILEVLKASEQVELQGRKNVWNEVLEHYWEKYSRPHYYHYTEPDPWSILPANHFIEMIKEYQSQYLKKWEEEYRKYFSGYDDVKSMEKTLLKRHQTFFNQSIKKLEKALASQEGLEFKQKVANKHLDILVDGFHNYRYDRYNGTDYWRRAKEEYFNKLAAGIFATCRDLEDLGDKTSWERALKLMTNYQKEHGLPRGNSVEINEIMANLKEATISPLARLFYS